MWVSERRIVRTPRIRRTALVKHIVIGVPVGNGRRAGSGTRRQRTFTDACRSVKTRYHLVVIAVLLDLISGVISCTPADNRDCSLTG